MIVDQNFWKPVLNIKNDRLYQDLANMRGMLYVEAYNRSVRSVYGEIIFDDPSLGKFLETNMRKDEDVKKQMKISMVGFLMMFPPLIWAIWTVFIGNLPMAFFVILYSGIAFFDIKQYWKLKKELYE